MSDNLAQADEIWRFTNSDPAVFKLQSYVWETMKQQSITFQIPLEILTGVRRYYERSDVFARSLAVGQGTAIEAARLWQKETQNMRDKVVPAMEKDIAALRNRLMAQGLNVK